MLKKAAFALTLAVFAVQTVGWVECCCILICKHQNDPCKDECKDQPRQPQAAAPDCCEKPAAAAPSGAPAHRHDQRCAHVQPSSEVDSQTSAVQIDVPLLALERLPLPEIAPPDGR